ncbi:MULTISPECIES: bifunctional helix-turn-helix transcriptional regulator/GNAT family N-acetyltransferase [unclassified Nocardioides]|uniref:bifunctional helix-turn-helix transcriptional regulator/GNAT family N-acetyltransferase n=1 Tax=unclassified Nocardioides TaxID=2615069 RepID=UPI0006F5E4DA|nr:MULTISPECIES: bifunctional helix-turn-helix transcriptional regulator/GNAT family N-acetyltransferase [unclassified Nocardioides]KQY63581.1 PadR family transcriptional regulator [Nocardioides sp. Root140]KRF15598.1 PadR family transcriptional regulator [Nocardioides sp. Soil796]
MLSAVETLRHFNRAWSQRVGVLDESFLGSGRPLGPSRLLFEIGSTPGGAVVRDLRDRLGLDSGHLSRLLRRLESEGLVAMEPDPHDARRRVATLTPDGRATWSELEDRSDELARQIVEPLTERQGTRLAEALATAELLVRAATVDISPVDPASPEGQSAMASYFAEIDRRLESGFDAGDASASDAATLRAPYGVFLLARSEGRTAACGGVRDLGDGIAEIKRMWVSEDWRGAGLGGRMLRELEASARDLGHTTVRLDTNGTLVEAIAMYDRAGYSRIERYNDNPYAQAWFEKRL